jgi:hypothetical protein
MLRRLPSHRSRTISKQSSSFVRRRRERTVLSIGVSIFIVILTIYGLSRLSALKSLSITSVRVYGADPEITLQVETAVNDVLAGKYMGLFSKSNIFLYPERTMIAAVVGVSPRIEHIELSTDKHTLTVSVSQKNAAAVVCASLPDFEGNELVLERAENCHFVDRTGRIFAPAPSFSGTGHKHYYAPDIKESSSTMMTKEFEALQEFYDGVRQAGIAAEAILIKPDGEYELYIRNLPAYITDNTSPATAIVYFNTIGDFSTELTNLVSFWTNMRAKARSDGIYPVYDSIDIRYGSNVFYRLIN